MTLSRDRIFPIINITVLILFSASILYPMINLVALSFSDPLSVAQNLVTVFPVDPTLDIYKLLFNSNQIMLSYANTIIYCLISTTLTLAICSMAAYPLSLPSFHSKLRNFFVVVVIIPMFVEGGLIPTFMIVQSLGLYNSMWAVILPPVFSTWYIILIRTMMRSIPPEMRESARIDGAGEFRVYLQIIMPLVKPVLATIALFAAVAMWNAYFAPLIFLQDADKYPLQMVLRRLQEGTQGVSGLIGTSEFTYSQAGLMQVLRSAAMVVTIGPIIFIYPFLQRYFIKGIMVGSLKS